MFSMITYYLDLNALSYCLGGYFSLQGWTQTGADALRAAIAASLKRDDISILGSDFHLEEASRIPDASERRRLFDFFWTTTGWLLLMPTYSLARAEAKSGGRLTGYDAFERVMERARLKQRCKNDIKLDQLAADVRAYAENGRVDQKARKEAVTQ